MIIYKTTNLVNGKIYIGKDANDNPDYLGSGKVLNIAINKYGRHNFRKKIIEVCDGGNWQEREVFWINKLNSRNPKIGYNITPGGDGTGSGKDSPRFGKKNSKKTREAARLANIGNKNHLGKKHYKETIAKMSQPRPSVAGRNNPFFGKKHTKETTKKIAKILSKMFIGEKNPFFGKKHTEETRRKMSENHADFRGKKNPCYGMKKGPHTEETKKKMSLAHKGRKNSAQHNLNISLAQSGKKHWFYGKHHTKESNKKRSASLKKFYANKRLGA